VRLPGTWNDGVRLYEFSSTVRSSIAKAFTSSKRRTLSSQVSRKRSRTFFANEEASIYQSLLGAWPPIEADRLKKYVTKALREGKTHSSWIDIDEEYEHVCLLC
jgi:maltooligosyltrehalose synthase